MGEIFVIRRAQPDDADVLGQITLAGLYHWGHKENFPELMEDFKNTNLPSPDYIRESPVYVLADSDTVIGYYGLFLEPEKPFVDLRYMFVHPDYIGQGFGKKLWLASLEQAKKLNYDKMRIISDPGAVDFYAAMGATRDTDHEIHPGFVLTVFWFDL